MPISPISSNRQWARVVIETLTRHGVRHICIAPGSRSTPLTLAAAEHSRLVCHTHFDERGLGHMALGLAKATREPVAVIVTSGTAAANLYPALIEASLTGERLIMLTADRPPELIDCGANQAIRQTGLFGDFPGRTLPLPRPTAEIAARWLVSALDQALTGDQGPVHINCPFAEPLYDTDEARESDWTRALGDWWQSDGLWLEQPRVAGMPVEADWPEWRRRRGVVIAGRLPPEQGVRLARWAAELGWPLIGDVLSQTGQPLPYADLWLGHPGAADCLSQAELIIQFGGALTGKRLLQWQQASETEQYWLIDPLPGRLDPAQHRGRRIVAAVGAWLDAHPATPGEPWATALTDYARLARRRISEALPEHLSEAGLARDMAQLLPEGGRLFLGNSLIIRLVDALSQLPAGYPVFGNRGASGIDGLLSTAAGVLRGEDRPLLVLLGDISTLYDLNGLALFRQAPSPTVIVVVNNDGGQIFSLLPTPREARDQFYVMPQGIDFRHAAALFGLDYACYAQPDSPAALRNELERAWHRRRGSPALLIELKVAPQEGAELFRTLAAEMARP